MEPTVTAAVTETAETVAETSVSAGFSFSLSNVLFSLLSAFFIIIGLASLITGKVYGMGRSAEKYTDESLARYARPYGLCWLLFGIADVLFNCYFHFGFKNIVFVILSAVLFVLSLIGFLVIRKYLVKKQ